ncbi:MAG: hypothetical protein KBE65_17460 [Phycisphaerae bacterium]|nr:hypothetical protein [Phycisphaerae bacterium]
MRRLANALVVGCVLTVLLANTASAEDMGEIACGETESGTIAAAGEKDSWTFSASAGDRVLLSVMTTSGSLYPYVVVYAPDASQEAAAYRHINREMSQTGTYTVVIYDGDTGGSDISLDDTGGYKISFANLDGCSWPTISCGETLSGTVDVSDTEVWHFFASAGDRIVLTVTATSGDLFPYVGVYAPDGSGEAAAYQHIDREVSQTGIYTVVIYDGYTSGSDGYFEDAGGYKISFANLDGCSWPTISCGETLSGTVDVSDTEVWHFFASAGDRIVLTVTATSGDLFPYVGVYAPDGSGEAAAYQHIDREVSQTGIYTVVIYDGYTSGSDGYFEDAGGYKISLTCSDNKPDLSISSLTVSRNPVVRCEGDATVSWAVKNGGGASATPTGYSLRVRLSTDDTYDESDTLVGQTPINVELLAGETVSGTYALDPNSLAPGDYYLVAKVDVENTVEESSEDNNTQSVSVIIALPSINCSLTVSSTDGGSVESPGEGFFNFDCGSSVSVKAVPDSGYKFVRWTGTAVDAGAVADPTNPMTTVSLIVSNPLACSGVDYTVVANFEEQNKPLEVQTVEATDITPKTALLHGQIVEGGGAPCEYRFRYWKAGNAQKYETAWASGGQTGMDFSMFIAELSPATTYEFWAEARSSGVFTTGDVVSFTTPVRLTVSASEGGTVVHPGIGVFEYSEPNEVRIVAEVTDPNYYFWTWTGSAAEGGKVANIASSDTTVLVDADDTLHAAFLERVVELGDDLNGAPCRGSELSTSQFWDFNDTDQTDSLRGVYDLSGPAPAGLDPLPGTHVECADPSPQAKERWWANDVHWGSGREGLFAVSGLRVSINVWNSSETRTIVRLQLVWHEADESDSDLFPADTPKSPVLTDLEPTPAESPLLLAEVTLGAGWHHSTYTWQVAPSPERVAFTLRGRIVMDVLIAETCTEDNPVIHVDDDAIHDPGPGDMAVSDALEDGTPEHPFDSVQEGIDAAQDGDTVLVHDGRYVETVVLSDKAITVTGQWLQDTGVRAPSILDANGLSPVVRFVGGKGRQCVVAGLTILGGKGLTDAAIVCEQAEPVISNCLVCGNMVMDEDGAVINCVESKPSFVNCTISGNRAGAYGSVWRLRDSDLSVTNSIVWVNTGSAWEIVSGSGPRIAYSDLDRDWSGQGMLNSEPCFVEPGHWYDAGTPDDLSDDLWIEGDYHLQSRQGRFEIETGVWRLDDLDSPCIDAGNPLSLWQNEPSPNGARINLGTYGGTGQASKSHLSGS